MTYRILITGSREIAHRDTVADAITNVWRENGRPHLTVVHGGARGADRIAGQVASQNRDRATEEIHLAVWRPDGQDGPVDKLAGFTRNQLMVDLGADVCLAFLKEGAKNSGTRDCIRRAQKAGIPVIETWEPAPACATGASSAQPQLNIPLFAATGYPFKH